MATLNQHHLELFQECQQMALRRWPSHSPRVVLDCDARPPLRYEARVELTQNVGHGPEITVPMSSARTDPGAAISALHTGLRFPVR